MNLYDEQQAEQAPPGVDVVLGLGVTGLSCTRWLAARGREVRVYDSRERPPAPHGG